MTVRENLPLAWLAMVVGGLYAGLSHSSARSLLGDWIGAFGIVGCLCTMLADKLGTYRPWQDPERVPRTPPLGPPQPPDVK